MTKKAIVLLADGFEEVEAVTPIDYLRRAGVEVTIASVSLFMTVKGARRIQVNANTELAGVGNGAGEWDAIIIPGGASGAENIAASEEACALLKNMAAAGKLICAICASPAVVLAPLGLLEGKKFTCYPGLEVKVTDGKWSEDRVVIDGNIITSRSAGTAGEFAIAIIEKLINKAAAQKIADAVLLQA
jgi:4-methyl-5(b-hydroxyethyl)-thiazole monophosphate biosynthesis